MEKILFKELSYKITGICFKIQKELGRFCREKQYCDKLEQELKKEGINFFREYEIKNFNYNSPKGNRVDFLIEGKIIFDAKTKNFITKDDYYQMQRYLKGANLELGMIVNFSDSYLKPKRVLNSCCNKQFGSFGFNSDHSDGQIAKKKFGLFGLFGFNSDYSDRLAGFTLVETLIYVAIIGAVVTSFISFGMSISSARNKNYAIQEVQANTRIAINIVQQKIREASGINIGASTFGSDPGVLSLSMLDAGKNPTIISLNQDDGQLQITEGVNSPMFLTSGKVKITNLIFNNLTPLHGKGNIGIELKTEYNITNADKSFQYEKSIRTAENLR